MKFINTLIVLLVLTGGLEASRIVGSDWMGPVVGEVMYGAGHSCKFKGSYGIRDQLTKGEADVAIVASAPGEDNKFGEGLVAMPFGYRVGVLHKSKENPIEAITVEDFRRIFGAEGVFMWDRLGYDGEWKKHPIHPVGLEFNEGIDLEYVRYTALENQNWSKRVTFYDKAKSLRNYLRRSKDGLFLANGVMRDLGEVMKIRVGDEVVTPSPRTVFSGKYPIRLPFYLVYREGEEEKLGKVLKELYGEKIAERLEKYGYWPVPSGVRKKFLSK